jgi:iron complex outermembrane receptor protein
MKNLRLLRLVTLASVSVTAMSAAAFAQSAGVGTDTETVVVTGSRVITDVANSPTPLTVVSTQQLLATTPSNLADGLAKLPVFQGNSSERNSSSGAGNSSGDFLDLRNFGQQRTLVLMDGMRLPSSNQAGSVDISTLPQELFSRVDVVTGGGSAVYGSDAITGVVNLVLDKNYTGMKYEANAGISMYADGARYKLNLAAGTDILGGRGHIEGAVGYTNNDGVLGNTRPSGMEHLGSYNSGTTAASPIINIANSGQTVSTASGKITCSACTVSGDEFVTPGVPGPIAYGFIPPGQTALASNCIDCARVDTTSLYSDTRNATFFGRMSYNLDNDISVFTQMSLAQANTFGYFFPSQSEPSRQTVNYFKNNAFLPAATQAALGNNSATDPNFATDGSNIFQVSEWYDAPNRTRQTSNDTRNWIWSSGINGTAFGGFDWEAHYTHGETRASTTGIRNGNNQYHDAAQDAVVDPATGAVACYNDTAAAIALYGNIYPGCVPINEFGNNVTTDAQYNYWSRSTEFAETNTMDDIAGDISGNVFDLPAGPIRAAFAGEMRWLQYRINSDASPTALVNCYGLRLCGNAAGTGPVNQSTVSQALWDNNTVPSVYASENVWEFSGEVGIPILKDLPFVQNLDADVAGRYTNYSISGAVQTWKIGLDYHVNDSVRFRATTSVDIRAPTLNDLYSPQTSNSGPYLDPLTNFNPGGIQTVAQGNPNLVPEVSRTYTGGVVLTPSFIPGLTASIDYYQIKVKNAIGTVTGTNTSISNLCVTTLPVGSSPFCSLYVRPFPYTNTTPANYPSVILSESLNAAYSVTEGEDHEVDYGFDTADVYSELSGLVNLRALLNVAPVLNAIQFPGAPVSHTTNPKTHATLLADYTLGNWSVNAEWHYFGDLYKNPVYGTGQTFYAVNRVRSFKTTDFTLTKKIHFDNDTAASVYFNVQNAFNDIPPDTIGSPSNPGGVAVPSGEDVMGRFFTIGIRGDL